MCRQFIIFTCIFTRFFACNREFAVFSAPFYITYASSVNLNNVFQSCPWYYNLTLLQIPVQMTNISVMLMFYNLSWRRVMISNLICKEIRTEVPSLSKNAHCVRYTKYLQLLISLADCPDISGNKNSSNGGLIKIV